MFGTAICSLRALRKGAYAVHACSQTRFLKDSLNYVLQKPPCRPNFFPTSAKDLRIREKPLYRLVIYSPTLALQCVAMSETTGFRI